MLVKNDKWVTPNNRTHWVFTRQWSNGEVLRMTAVLEPHWSRAMWAYELRNVRRALYGMLAMDRKEASKKVLRGLDGIAFNLWKEWD